MSAEITVVFCVDLSSCSSNSTSWDQSQAIEAIEKTLKDAGLRASYLNRSGENHTVLQLPCHAQVLSAVLYSCETAGIPYKTLWLNDVAQWHEGGKNDEPVKL